MDNLDIFKILANYGAIGVTLFVCFWYITQKDKAQKTSDKEHRDDQIVLMKSHYEEREKWSEKMQAMHQEAMQQAKNGTTALTELVTLIRDRKGV